MFFYLSISTFATSEVILFLVQGGMIVQQTSLMTLENKNWVNKFEMSVSI